MIIKENQSFRKSMLGFQGYFLQIIHSHGMGNKTVTWSHTSNADRLCHFSMMVSYQFFTR